MPGEIYEIPISSPAHNVTYVTVEDDDDDEWATFATAAMYTGVMVAWGCAVWGSGWYYPPYYGGFYGGYPCYYGHYPTYGYGASYNPWTGAYGRGAVAYGPYGGAGVGARYNPRTGTYSRGAAAYGPYGSRGRGPGLQPAHRRLRPDAPGLERLRKLGQHPVQRGDQWAQHRAGDEQRATGDHHARDAHGSGGGEAVTRARAGRRLAASARTGSGDVYAGRDGNVYRKQGGSWQKYDNGNWGSVDRPRAQPAAPRASADTTTRTAGAGSATDGPAQPRLARRARRARSARATTAATAAGAAAAAPTGRAALRAAAAAIAAAAAAAVEDAGADPARHGRIARSVRRDPRTATCFEEAPEWTGS